MFEENSSCNNHAKGFKVQMMGDLYAGAMDSSAINKTGYTPIVNDLKRIDGLSSASDIVKECAYEYSRGGGNLFGAYVGPDDRNAAVNKLQFSQSGLSLPGR